MIVMAWFDCYTQIANAQMNHHTTWWWLHGWQWREWSAVCMARAATTTWISITTVIVKAGWHCISESLCKTAIPCWRTDSQNCIVSPPAIGISVVFIVDVWQLEYHIIVVIVWWPTRPVILRIFIRMIIVLVAISEFCISAAVMVSKMLLWWYGYLQFATEYSSRNWCSSWLALQLQPHQSVYLIHTVDTRAQLLNGISVRQQQQLLKSSGNVNGHKSVNELLVLSG